MDLLSIDAFKKLADEGATIIDTRNSELIAEGIIENSIVIAFDEKFLEHLSQCTQEDEKLLFVADSDDLPRLSKMLRVSGDFQVAGALAEGFEIWQKASYPIDFIISIQADEFQMDYHYDEFFLIDVRSSEIYASEHLEDSENVPLSDLQSALLDMEASDLYYVYAASAAEALTAGSLFKKYGFNRLRVVEEDYATIRKTEVPRFVKKKTAEDKKISDN